MPTPIPHVPDSRRRRRLAGFAVLLLVLAALVPGRAAALADPAVHVPDARGDRPGLRLPPGGAVGHAGGAGGRLVLRRGLWRGGRWWSRALLVLALVPLAGAAWLARQNIFEKMFAPLADPRFARAAEASWMADGDMVMAVERNGEAVAYPVRQLAYHHIVQDVVGGVPIVGHLLNALSHRSGVESGGRRAEADAFTSRASTTRTSSCGTRRRARGGSR